MKIFLYYPLKRGGAYPQFFGKRATKLSKESIKTTVLFSSRGETVILSLPLNFINQNKPIFNSQQPTSLPKFY